MALLNFPDPSVIQTYTANGNSWEWNGTSWVSANNLNLSDQVTGVLGTVYGGTGQALSGMTVGSVIYADTSSSFAALAPGINNYVLATQGNGAAPYWKIDDSGTGSVGNGNTGGFAYYNGLNTITSSTGVSYISVSNRIVLTSQILSLPSSVIDSGVWAGTAISLANGGTNGNRSGVGVSYELAVYNAAGTAITQIDTTSSIGNSVLLQVTQDSFPIWVGQSSLTAGNATSAQKVNVSLYTGTGTSFLVFSDVRNGTASLGTTGFITINASTGTIGATSFAGNATTATSAGSAGTSVTAGSAGTAVNAGLAQKANVSLYTGTGTSFLVFSDVTNGTASLGTTGFITINASTGTIGATSFAGNATTATSAGSAGTAVNAGSAFTSVNAGLAVTSTNAGLSQKVNLSLYTGTGTSFLVFSDVTNGTASLGSTGFITINASTGTIGATSFAGNATTATSAGSAGTAVNAGSAGTAVNAGLAQKTNVSLYTGTGTSFLVFSDVTNGTASLGTTSFITINASTGTIGATSFAGNATTATSAGSAGTAVNAGSAFTSVNAGLAVTATNAGLSQKVNVSLYTGTGTSFLVFSDVRNGVASLGTTGFITINASTGTIGATSFAGNATTATSAGSAGTAVNAGSAGTAVNAGLAVTATDAGRAEAIRTQTFTGTDFLALLDNDNANATSSIYSGSGISVTSSLFVVPKDTRLGNNTQSTNTSSGALIVNGGLGVTGNVNVGGNFVLTGDLTVNGTTTTVNSTVSTIVDPIITIGTGIGGIVPSSADSKDRGIAFYYVSGTGKTGFFGWDQSVSKFALFADAIISGEVVSGTRGVLAAELDGIAGGATTAGSAVTAVNAGLAQKAIVSLYTGTGTSFLVFSDVTNGTASLGTTGFITINASTGTIGATSFAGNATTATSAGSAGTAVNAGSAFTSVNAGLAVTSTNAGLSQKVNVSLYTGTGTSFLVFSDVTNGTASLGSTGFITINASTGTIGATSFAGNATTATSAGSAGTAVNAGSAGTAVNAGLAQKAIVSLYTGTGTSFLVFSDVRNGTASLGTTGFITINASTGTIGATSFAGNATTATSAGSAGTAVNAGSAGTAVNAGLAVTSTNAGLAQKAIVSLYTGTGTSFLVFSDVTNGTASLGTTSFITINASTGTIGATSFAGNATTATSAGSAGTAVNAGSAGTAVNAGLAVTSTNAGNAALAQKLNLSTYTGAGTSFLVFSDVSSGTASLGTTSFITINANAGSIGATLVTANHKGTWTGTAVTALYGGTGLDTVSKLNVLTGASSGNSWVSIGSSWLPTAYVGEFAPPFLAAFGATQAGQLWWDSTYGVLKVYYADANTNQWVDALPVLGSNGGSAVKRSYYLSFGAGFTPATGADSVSVMVPFAADNSEQKYYIKRLDYRNETVSSGAGVSFYIERNTTRNPATAWTTANTITSAAGSSFKAAGIYITSYTLAGSGASFISSAGVAASVISGDYLRLNFTALNGGATMAIGVMIEEQ